MTRIALALLLALAACDEAPRSSSPAPTPVTGGPDPPSQIILALAPSSDAWRADLRDSAERARERLSLGDAGDALTLGPAQLQRGVAHALELLQRPVQPYYLPPGEAGRMKQNYHVYTLGRHDGSWPSAPQSDADYVVAQVMTRLDRDPEALTDLYDAVRPLLPMVLSQRAYDDGPVSLYVETLLKTYREIVGTEGWERVFADITTALETPRDPAGYCTPLQCGAFIRKLAAPETLETLRSPCEETDLDSEYAEYCGYRNAYWFYAFWYRRHIEGNMDAVHDILVDVEKSYGGILASSERRR